jgi:hypothetical protein
MDEAGQEDARNAGAREVCYICERTSTNKRDLLGAQENTRAEYKEHAAPRDDKNYCEVGQDWVLPDEVFDA